MWECKSIKNTWLRVKLNYLISSGKFCCERSQSLKSLSSSVSRRLWFILTLLRYQLKVKFFFDCVNTKKLHHFFCITVTETLPKHYLLPSLFKLIPCLCMILNHLLCCCSNKSILYFWLSSFLKSFVLSHQAVSWYCFINCHFFLIWLFHSFSVFVEDYLKEFLIFFFFFVYCFLI